MSQQHAIIRNLQENLEYERSRALQHERQLQEIQLRAVQLAAVLFGVEETRVLDFLRGLGAK